ncbi:MAG TPA: hypothetical protein PKE39_02085 [Ignavibacteria bacterium]|nr:hypothetical protein [Ignavibacteria bacterium]HMQ97789.1 hypothetical protein [Ignavibacteria bacterium]
MQEKIHRHRMDFYYQSLVIYLLFFAAYVLIRGTVGESFKALYNDPIFYILILFIIIFLFLVVLNIIRSPMIILKSDRITFRNRFGEREVLFSDILTVKIGRRRKREEEMTYRIIKLKLKNRRKQLRIRANDFERGGELINEFLKIKQHSQGEKF